MKSFLKTFVNVCMRIVLVIGVIYLAFPSPPFPIPPPDSVQSLEDADTETPFRRAYFTNFSREETRAHYQQSLSNDFLIPFPSYIVSYPPEDAQTLIRDQTRSVNLSEIIRPLRESLFVNFFEAQTPKDEIRYKGVLYERKITVRYVPSSLYLRVAVFLGSYILFLILATSLWRSFVNIVTNLFLSNR